MSEQNTAGEVTGVIDPSKQISWEDVKKSAAAPSEEAKPKEEAKAPVEEKAEPEATVDYEAEIAKYKAKAEREKSLREYEREQRRQLEKKMQSKTEEIVEVEEETPDLDEIVDRKLNALRLAEKDDVIDDILFDLSDNPKERELVKTIYENSLRPSGYSKKAIRNDLESAMLIANRARVESIAFTKAKEKVRADMAKERAMNEAASTGSSLGRKPPESAPSYTSNEMRWLSRVGKTKANE